MGAIMINLLYFTISLTLVALVGRALSRSGAAFLAEMFADRGGVAEAVNRLLVVAFYLLSCGFIALTMPVWEHVGSAGQALQLLSGKIGELLLVLGALHVASTVVFARLRRAPSWPAQSGPGGFSPRTAASGRPGPDSSGSDSPGSDTSGSYSPGSYSPGSGLSGSGLSGSGLSGSGLSGSGLSGSGLSSSGRPTGHPVAGPANDWVDADAAARVAAPALWRPRCRHVVH